MSGVIRHASRTTGPTPHFAPSIALQFREAATAAGFGRPTSRRSVHGRPQTDLRQPAIPADALHSPATPGLPHRFHATRQWPVRRPPATRPLRIRILVSVLLLDRRSLSPTSPEILCC